MFVLLSMLTVGLFSASDVSAASTDNQFYQTAFLYFLPDYQPKQQDEAEVRGCAKLGYTVTRSNCAAPRILKDKCPSGNSYKTCYCAGSPTCTTGSTSSSNPYPSSTGASSTNCKNCAGNTLYTWTCSASSCSAYSLSSCPSNGNCSQCCNGKYKLDSCAFGYELSGGSCSCATTCTDKVSSKPANSSYTTSSCTACGVTTTIKTGWSCNAGYTKSGDSCVEECNSSSSNWCPVHSSCHVNCCTDGTIQPCDTRCGGSGCSSNNSDDDDDDNSGDDSGTYNCSYRVVCREAGGTWLGEHHCSVQCYIWGFKESYNCIQKDGSWVLKSIRYDYCLDEVSGSVYKEKPAPVENDIQTYSSQSECNTEKNKRNQEYEAQLSEYEAEYPEYSHHSGYMLADRYCKNWNW